MAIPMRHPMRHPYAPPRLPPRHSQAVASALLPKLEKTRKEVENLLFEVVTLEVGLGWG